MKSKKGVLKFGMQTDLLNTLVTNHAQKIDFIKRNEQFEVVEVEVKGPVTEVTANYTYEEMN